MINNRQIDLNIYTPSENKLEQYCFESRQCKWPGEVHASNTMITHRPGTDVQARHAPLSSSCEETSPYNEKPRSCPSAFKAVRHCAGRLCGHSFGVADGRFAAARRPRCCSAVHCRCGSVSATIVSMAMVGLVPLLKIIPKMRLSTIKWE